MSDLVFSLGPPVLAIPLVSEYLTIVVRERHNNNHPNNPNPQTTYYIPRALILSKSYPFHTKPFNHPALASEALEVPSNYATPLGDYVDWLHHGSIRREFNEYHMIPLYHLASSFNTLPLKNDILDWMQVYCPEYPDSIPFLKYAVSILDDVDSTFMRYLISQLAYDASRMFRSLACSLRYQEIFQIPGSDVGERFRAEFDTFRALPALPDPGREKDCKWHEHPLSMMNFCRR